VFNDCGSVHTCHTQALAAAVTCFAHGPVVFQAVDVILQGVGTLLGPHKVLMLSCKVLNPPRSTTSKRCWTHGPVSPTDVLCASTVKMQNSCTVFFSSSQCNTETNVLKWIRGSNVAHSIDLHVGASVAHLGCAVLLSCTVFAAAVVLDVLMTVFVLALLCCAVLPGPPQCSLTGSGPPCS
jgi:hypothetical protein